IVIVVLYISIGGMSAAGSVYIARSIFSAKTEQIFFGLFLIPIAVFYLAFMAYFGDQHAWQLEAMAVAVFSVFGLLGVRFPFAHSRIPPAWCMGRSPRVCPVASADHIRATGLRLLLRHLRLPHGGIFLHSA